MSKEELLKYLIAEIDLIMHDKDYRFENQDGTWYSRESCRDLTNEELFEELRTELRHFSDLEAREKAYQEGFLQKQFDKDMEIMQPKQQLAEKENTITNLIEDTNASKEFYKKQFNEQVWLCEELREKLAEKDQDKISFAVEQLNLLYKTLTTEDVWKTMKKGWWLNNGECLQLRQTIDQQIEQLKEVM